MEMFYIRFGQRHSLPSTRQILKELGQRNVDIPTRHPRSVPPEPIFHIDIYGRKVNG